MPDCHAQAGAAPVTQHTLPKSSPEDGEGDEDRKKAASLPTA